MSIDDAEARVGLSDFTYDDALVQRVFFLARVGELDGKRMHGAQAARERER